MIDVTGLRELGSWAGPSGWAVFGTSDWDGEKRSGRTNYRGTQRSRGYWKKSQMPQAKGWDLKIHDRIGRWGGRKGDCESPRRPGNASIPIPNGETLNLDVPLLYLSMVSWISGDLYVPVVRILVSLSRPNAIYDSWYLCANIPAFNVRVNVNVNIQRSRSASNVFNLDTQTGARNCASMGICKVFPRLSKTCPSLAGLEAGSVACTESVTAPTRLVAL
ncbi:hypothetical protein PAXRUDRAFT_28526 [Paxillus rubicundulus Ve08.2h10]|uniref:Uncharacterized protein n=1 Tax=Paxillus rubicundulus Ve08.2h10 TaxID=930991 RepID=A0A0D0D5D5_9AGAM|nr:hypothetical protein PAXRUDRAFT_28526 [Paxillus rubicundulus Ve08.2h10]